MPAYDGPLSDTDLPGNGASPPSLSTANGSINLPSGAQYKINGAQISSADLSDGPLSRSQSTIYNTTINETNTGVPFTTMATPKSDTNYLFTIYIAQMRETSGCSSQPKASAAIQYTSAFGGVRHGRWALTGNIMGGMAPQATFSSKLSDKTEYSATFSFRAKENTSVQYAVAFSPGSGCIIGATYSVAPSALCGRYSL